MVVVQTALVLIFLCDQLFAHTPCQLLFPPPEFFSCCQNFPELYVCSLMSHDWWGCTVELHVCLALHVDTTACVGMGQCFSRSPGLFSLCSGSFSFYDADETRWLLLAFFSIFKIFCHKFFLISHIFFSLFPWQIIDQIYLLLGRWWEWKSFLLLDSLTWKLFLAKFFVQGALVSWVSL